MTSGQLGPFGANKKIPKTESQLPTKAKGANNWPAETETIRCPLLRAPKIKTRREPGLAFQRLADE